MASFCVICDRLFCRHTGSRYEDDRFEQLAQFEPVDTMSGERARRLALSILEPRHAALDQRSREEFQFSEIERQHMGALAGTITTLQGMAPVGELAPSRAGGSFDLVLT